MLTPEEAWQHISKHLSPLGSERVGRAEALGRTLTEALASTVDLPPADVSAMDGYALAGPVTPGDSLPVTAISAAGSPSEQTLFPGQAAKIMTGAVVPPGADRVIPVEQSDGGTERVVFRESPAEGAHIRRCGEVVRAGNPLLRAGSLLTPGAISLLAAHGYGSVSVVRQPRVAVITTGNELVPPEKEPGPGELRDSNSSFLLAAGATLGLRFEHLGIAPDDRGTLEEMIRAGLERDVLLLSGGVSMGDYDFVEDVLGDLGCETLFDRVAIQPGKPLVAARGPGSSGGWIFGLPGNPASVMVTFWLFVRPVLRCLVGGHDAFWSGSLQARLAGPQPGSKGRDRFLPAEIRFHEGSLLATPLPPQGSHDVVAYGQGLGLVRIRPHARSLEPGAPCEILPLVDWPAGPAELGVQSP